MGCQTACKKSVSGVTLVEMMMVLVIGMLLILFGIRTYNGYQNTLQLQQLRYNVDELLQAVSNYYEANCQTGGFSPKPPSFPSPYPSSGTGITYPPTATTYFPVSIVSILKAQGYLDAAWSPTNPLVDPSAGESGYIVQLSPVIASGETINACVVLSPGTACIPSTPTSTVTAAQAKIVYWMMQVAVKIKNTNNINAYYAALGADCMSDAASTNTVTPCSGGATSYQYVVWSRSPTFSSVQKESPYTSSLFTLRQENLLYTHDQNYELNSGYTTGSQAPVYYLCGG